MGVALVIARFLLFAGPACPTAEFSEASKKLDKTEVTSLLRMADRWQQLATGQSPDCLDALFDTYWGFYHNVQEAQLARLETLGRKRLDSELAKVGWAIHESEAGDFVAERG